MVLDFRSFNSTSVHLSSFLHQFKSKLACKILGSEVCCTMPCKFVVSKCSPSFQQFLLSYYKYCFVNSVMTVTWDKEEIHPQTTQMHHSDGSERSWPGCKIGMKKDVENLLHILAERWHFDQHNPPDTPQMRLLYRDGKSGGGKDTIK